MKKKNTKEFVIELSKLQKKNLPAIEWLISDDRKDRCSGRSFLLAVAFIKKAMQNPGRRVRVFDHSDLTYGAKRLFDDMVDMKIPGISYYHTDFSIKLSK